MIANHNREGYNSVLCEQWHSHEYTKLLLAQLKKESQELKDKACKLAVTDLSCAELTLVRITLIEAYQIDKTIKLMEENA